MGYLSRLPTDNEPTRVRLTGTEKEQAAMIRRLRKENNWTLNEASDHLGVGVEDLKTILICNPDIDY